MTKKAKARVELDKSRDGWFATVSIPVSPSVASGFFCEGPSKEIATYLLRERFKAMGKENLVDWGDAQWFTVWGHTSEGQQVTIEIQADNGAEAMDRAKELRPDCKFIHSSLTQI